MNSPTSNNMTVQFQHIAGILNVDALLGKTCPRVDSPEELAPPSVSPLGLQTDDRHLCLPPQQPVTTILKLPPGPSSLSNRCIPTKVATSGPIITPLPWKVIPQVFRKLQSDREQRALLISPYWPTQFWWAQLLNQAHGPPLCTQISGTKTFAAWILSGIITPPRV